MTLHRVIPMIRIYSDGYREHVCLECLKPIARSGETPQGWRWKHYSRPEWKPR